MNKEAMKLKQALEASEWIAAQRTGGMIQRKAVELVSLIKEALEHAQGEHMKTVIEMAEKAFETPGTEPAFRNGFWTVTQDELGRFTELVRADEREACAKVCEQQEDYGPLCETIWDCSAAIRARSKNEDRN